MTLQDIFLRGTTYFYRLNAFLAGAGILSGILLRIFTGQHKASFAILAFGLSCFYIAAASKYLVHNWFLKGESNPEYETKRRKWLVAYLLMGLPFWLPFGAIVTFSLFDRIYVNTFSINRSPMFDAEMSRILDNDDIRDFQSIQAFDKHRLILAKRDGGASSIMELALQTKKALSSHTHSPSHKYHIVIDNEVYMMTISPHQSRFDWRDFTKKARTHHHLCRLFIPVNIEAINETSPSPLRSGTSSIIFIDIPELNDFDLKITNHDLVIDNVLRENNSSVKFCRDAAYSYSKSENISMEGMNSLHSSPKIILKYLIMPGMTQGLESRESNFTYYLVQSPKKYLENVSESYGTTFNTWEP